MLVNTSRSNHCNPNPFPTHSTHTCTHTSNPLVQLRPAQACVWCESSCRAEAFAVSCATATHAPARSVASWCHRSPQHMREGTLQAQAVTENTVRWLLTTNIFRSVCVQNIDALPPPDVRLCTCWFDAEGRLVEFQTCRSRCSKKYASDHTTMTTHWSSHSW